MHSQPAVRSITIYAICLSLALILGYLLSSPLDWGSFLAVLSVLFALALPVLLRFHHPILLLGWNCTMILFFAPGAPRIWLPLVGLSLLISIIRRSLGQNFRFISVPQLTKPLLFLAAVVLATAEARGGIKLRSMGGGDLYGGRRYIFLLAAIAGYFAITAYRVPPKKAMQYVGLFLLGGVTTIIGDVLFFNSKGLQWIFWLFPPNMYALGNSTGLIRFAGLNGAASVLLFFMLAKYGIRDTFSSRHPIRFILFVLLGAISLLGGFRSLLITTALMFAIQFCMEGLHKTRLLPILLFGGALVAAAALPFIRQMPFSVQRTLSILPVDVDPIARMDAQASMDWRLQIWQAVLPQVPKYFWFGKGLGLSREDYDYSLSTFTGTMHEFSEDQSWAALAGDYHSGPLSVIIPFGIGGVVAFTWFLVAGCRALYRNFRYGNRELRIINAFLFSAFLTKIIIFLFVFGGFYGDMQNFVGYLALGVCVNGGVANPNPIPAEALEETADANVATAVSGAAV